MRYVPWDALRGRPNVIVDGPATDGTVLTLSHWRGSGTPEQLADDLSTQIVFRALDRPDESVDPALVSNNHFDEDGLCGIYALVRPEEARTCRALLEDIASAGDFGTYRSREALRIAFALGAFADPERSPLGSEPFARPYPEQAALLYGELLERLPAMLSDPDAFRALWEEEDAIVSRDQQRLASGAIAIEDRPAIDLAIVRVRKGPMPHAVAINNATACFRVLTLTPGRAELRYRYETWVRYVSRPTLPRVDLAPLAEQLTAREPAGVVWRFDGVQSIEPVLAAAGETGLPPDEIAGAVEGFLGAPSLLA